jgi:hypothetical protein
MIFPIYFYMDEKKNIYIYMENKKNRKKYYKSGLRI